MLKKITDLISFLPFLSAYPTWYKIMIAIGIFYAAIIIIIPIFFVHPNQNNTKLKEDTRNSTNETTPSALDVYLQVLGEQPDNSVTIISVGFLNNSRRPYCCHNSASLPSG